MDSTLSRVVTAVGGKKVLSDICGVTIGAVCHWKRLPIHHVATVSGFTGIPAHELRPDVYAPGSKAPAALDARAA